MAVKKFRPNTGGRMMGSFHVSAIGE